MINVLIADSQPLTQLGILTLLTDIKSIRVAGHFNTISELEGHLEVVQSEVIIISHEQYSSLEVIKRICGRFKTSRILILSNHPDKSEIMQLLDYGIKNYVHKSCSKEEFLAAVYATARSEQYFCKNVLSILFGDDPVAKRAEAVRMLSFREKEIIEMIAHGMGNRDIAEKLFLSIHTVKTHRKNIIRKLGFTFKHASELILILSYLNDFFI